MTAWGKAAAFAVLLQALCGSHALALEIELPVGSRLTAERNSPLDTFKAPLAAFDGQGVPSVAVEGKLERRAWRTPSPGLTPLQVILPLREQLAAQGYDLVFECAAAECGGFDFRFNVEVLPGPNMYVNIAEYRYLTALRGSPEKPDAAVGVLVSVTRGAAYVQVIHAVSGAELPELGIAPETVADSVGGAVASNSANRIAGLLLERGHVALDELEFDVGTTDLGAGPFASLAALAAFLKAEQGYSVMLVGHTDSIGSLENNIAVSRARALSVRARLIESHNVNPDLLRADGMGYLAPVASNLTEEGRTLNRRVEAVLLPAE